MTLYAKLKNDVEAFVREYRALKPDERPDHTLNGMIVQTRNIHRSAELIIDFHDDLLMPNYGFLTEDPLISEVLSTFGIAYDRVREDLARGDVKKLQEVFVQPDPVYPSELDYLLEMLRDKQ